MAFYQLSMNGQNFLVELNDKPAKHGFIQYFYIEAASPADAEMVAVDKIRNNTELKSITQNPTNDPPVIVLDEIDELKNFDGIDELETGKIWYSDKKWWQFWK